jgi:Xaa-Pro aminopeptidase
VLNVPVSTVENDVFGAMMEFEALTLCPIDTRCIVRELMRDDEVAWLNQYHATVRERIAPKVSGAALAWLQARTAPI